MEKRLGGKRGREKYKEREKAKKKSQEKVGRKDAGHGDDETPRTTVILWSFTGTCLL
jgi:hypothetical protein